MLMCLSTGPALWRALRGLPSEAIGNTDSAASYSTIMPLLQRYLNSHRINPSARIDSTVNLLLGFH
jgi:hypothetical protein